MRLPDHVVTERLVLRQWDAADEPALSAAIAASLEHLRPWMPWAGGEPVPAPDRIRWIEQMHREWAAGGDVVLGMVRTDGAVVGGTRLHPRAGPETHENGYWVHAEHACRGYATEASAALTDVAFTLPEIEFVEIHHDRANAASRRVPEKLGFTMTGECVPTDPPAPGEDRVHWCWRTTRADWLAR
jgi:ribosomal-protein-serine acetyltransferase